MMMLNIVSKYGKDVSKFDSGGYTVEVIVVGLSIWLWSFNRENWTTWSE